MRSAACACVLLAISVGLVTGCTPSSSEKVVLAGEWQATGGPYLLATVLVFDDRGNLQQAITRPAGDVDVTDDLISTHSSVNGDLVTFSYEIPLLGTQSFSGTFNADQTVITGEMTLTTRIFLTTVVTEEGSVTLTRVVGS